LITPAMPDAPSRCPRFDFSAPLRSTISKSQACSGRVRTHREDLKQTDKNETRSR
jgi:hypothetical protein